MITLESHSNLPASPSPCDLQNGFDIVGRIPIVQLRRFLCLEPKLDRSDVVE